MDVLMVILYRCRLQSNQNPPKSSSCPRKPKTALPEKLQSPDLVKQIRLTSDLTVLLHHQLSPSLCLGMLKMQHGRVLRLQSKHLEESRHTNGLALFTRSCLASSFVGMRSDMALFKVAMRIS